MKENYLKNFTLKTVTLKKLFFDNSFIFILCCLLGGMGWILAPSQMYYMSAEMAVGYRFVLAGFLTLAFAAVLRNKSRPQYFASQVIFIIQGLCMFSINYILAYYALNYVLSGVVAVVLSMLVIPNSLMEAVFFKRPYTKGKIIATIIGFIGVSCLFLGDHKDSNFGISISKGVLFCCTSMIFTSLGANLSQLQFSKYIKRETIDPIWAVGFAMLWGGLLSLLYVRLYLGKFYFPMEHGFIVPLFGLAFLSALIFIFYQILLSKKGAGFAAYVWVITPGIALLLSWLFEGLSLTSASALGVLMIMMGGFLNLTLKDEGHA